MSAFKGHVGFGFWKGALVVDTSSGNEEPSAGQFGRITSVKDLPSKKELTAYIKKAMELNEEGMSTPKVKKPKPELPVPPALAAALAKNKQARAVFEGFSPSQRREYSEWIADAKSDDTRTRRAGAGGGVDRRGEDAELEVPAVAGATLFSEEAVGGSSE